MEQNSNQQPAANNQQIVNTEAAKAKANDTSLAEIFNEAVYDVTVNRCRIYGYNNDPDYDYSKESKSMSLKEIKEKFDGQIMLSLMGQYTPLGKAYQYYDAARYRSL